MIRRIKQVPEEAYMSRIEELVKADKLFRAYLYEYGYNIIMYGDSVAHNSDHVKAYQHLRRCMIQHKVVRVDMFDGDHLRIEYERVDD